MDGWMDSQCFVDDTKHDLYNLTLHKVLTLIEYCNMSFWGWWGYNNKIFLSFLALLIVYICMAKCNPTWEFGGGSTCSLHFVHFRPIHIILFILKSLIIHRIFRTIMEPDGYFAAMKCKGANGISLYPF
jgi:hypothetical protein